MFNVTGSEVIILLLLALVILGPEKLPDAIRRFGRIYGELRRMGQGFQDELRDVLDEPMRELRSTADMARRAIEEPADDISDTAKGIGQTATDAFAAATKFSAAPVAGGVAKGMNKGPADSEGAGDDPAAGAESDTAADATGAGVDADGTTSDVPPYETNAPGEPIAPYETIAPGQPLNPDLPVSTGGPLSPDLPVTTGCPLNPDLPDSADGSVSTAGSLNSDLPVSTGGPLNPDLPGPTDEAVGTASSPAGGSSASDAEGDGPEPVVDSPRPARSEPAVVHADDDAEAEAAEQTNVEESRRA